MHVSMHCMDAYFKTVPVSMLVELKQGAVIKYRTISKNHRTVYVGRDLKDCLALTPCAMGRDTFHCPLCLFCCQKMPGEGEVVLLSILTGPLCAAPVAGGGKSPTAPCLLLCLPAKCHHWQGAGAACWDALLSLPLSQQPPDCTGTMG